MGRVRPQLVKRTAIRLRRENEDRFTTDFDENKKTVTELLDLNSKIMKNRIAGYITRLERRRRAKNGV
ncbi:MAG: 30S ribosomal protein S17e [Candidatus Hydrothermarchaeales archaeon]